jgi:hypothetical protein
VFGRYGTAPLVRVHDAEPEGPLALPLGNSPEARRSVVLFEYREVRQEVRRSFFPPRREESGQPVARGLFEVIGLVRHDLAAPFLGRVPVDPILRPQEHGIPQHHTRQGLRAVRLALPVSRDPRQKPLVRRVAVLLAENIPSQPDRKGIGPREEAEARDRVDRRLETKEERAAEFRCPVGAGEWPPEVHLVDSLVSQAGEVVEPRLVR